MSSSRGKDAGIEHVESTSALEEVFKRLINQRVIHQEQITNLAAIILGTTVYLSGEADNARSKVGSGKKALQLIEVVRAVDNGTTTDFLPLKKLLWTNIVQGWIQGWVLTDDVPEDRDLFANAILNLRLYGQIEIVALETILRESRPWRYLVCKLLERADKDSSPAVVAFMIRSILRDVLAGGEREILLKVARLLVSG